jgi:hypothetical protein
MFGCEGLQNVEFWHNLSVWSELAKHASAPVIFRALQAGFITFAFLASLGFIHASWALLQARWKKRALNFTFTIAPNHQMVIKHLN